MMTKHGWLVIMLTGTMTWSAAAMDVAGTWRLADVSVRADATKVAVDSPERPSIKSMMEPAAMNEAALAFAKHMPPGETILMLGADGRQEFTIKGKIVLAGTWVLESNKLLLKRDECSSCRDQELTLVDVTGPALIVEGPDQDAGSPYCFRLTFERVEERGAP